MGYTISKEDIYVKDLTLHPSYRQIRPYKEESLIAYTLRCSAHLVSPPQEDGESNEFECIDVAAQILILEEEIEKKWKAHQKRLKQSSIQHG